VAIAFRAAGAVTKLDVTASGSPQNFALPTGHTTNDLLVLVIVTDDLDGPATPSGWTKLGETSPGTPTLSPYYAPARTNVFWRIDTGALGSSVSVSFNTSNWPAGDPYVLGAVLAYSGCDTTTPIGEWNVSQTASKTLAQAHPQITTTLANDWLLTFRMTSGSFSNTFTISGGTNAERVDDQYFSELGLGMYDSNGALSAGLQTQRTTTASTDCDFGSVMWSVAIRPSPVAGATVAQVISEAAGSGSAFDATVVSSDGDWDSCSTSGLPHYQWGIDWDQDGGVVQDTDLISDNPWATFDTSGWTVLNSTVVRAVGEAPRVPQTLKMTSAAGVTPRVQASQKPVISDHPYRMTGWLYAPVSLGVSAQLQINWYDDSHVFVATSTTSATLTPGEWRKFDTVVTAPSTAGFGAVLFSLSGSPGAGLVLHGWGVMMLDTDGPGPVSTPGPGDLMTDVVLSQGISWGRGRDQARQTTPGAISSAGMSVINADERFSPENQNSPLFGDLDPARPMRGDVEFGGTVYPLYSGRVDDFTIRADQDDRTVDFTFVDDQTLLQKTTLSTEVYQSMRTGELINIILDLAGWTGGRSIDPGASVVPFWWAEGSDALAEITNLVKSEGPPSIAYVEADGTFVFRDRHHRLLYGRSITSQASYAAKALLDCAAPAATGLDFTAPFVYSHGARDIVNSVNFSVDRRRPDGVYTPVWTSDAQITIPAGSAIDIEMLTADPFLDAQDIVSGSDITWTGPGVVTTLLSRRSGSGLRITITAAGGAVVVTSLQVRAKSIPVVQTTKVARQDTASITKHGERGYQETAPWATEQDAYAIANMILLLYANRRPTVAMRVVAQNPRHYLEILTRTISDRIHIKNAELGLDSDFYIERVEHVMARQNQVGKAPVHSATFYCEKIADNVANPFTFDKRGAGFDQGVFDPIGSDDPATVFVFDHPVNGQFNLGQFGT
jgi:hypothetical protein